MREFLHFVPLSNFRLETWSSVIQTFFFKLSPFSPLTFVTVLNRNVEFLDKKWRILNNYLLGNSLNIFENSINVFENWHFYYTCNNLGKTEKIETTPKPAKYLFSFCDLHSQSVLSRQDWVKSCPNIICLSSGVFSSWR